VSTPTEPTPPENVPSYAPPPSGQPQAYGQAPSGQPQPYGQPSPSGAPTSYGVPYTPAGWNGPPLASWIQRVGAALLDALIFLGFVVVGAILGAILSNASSALGGLFVAVGYLAGIGFAIWQLVVQGRTGQTIGKRVVGIRVLRERDGHVIGAGLSIGRAILHVVDQLPCYLGYLWPLWDAKKQTFTDKIVQTVVIKA